MADTCCGKMSLRTRYPQMPVCIQSKRCRNPCTNTGSIVMNRVYDVRRDLPHPSTASGRLCRQNHGLKCTGWALASVRLVARIGIHSILLQLRAMVKGFVRCVICTLQALVVSPVTAPLVATWLVLQAYITRGCARTVEPAMNLASTTALSPSILVEFNSWAIYKMQKVRM